MSDLLECLIQIKALADTLSRVEGAEKVTGPISRAAEGEIGPVTMLWGRLAEAERHYAAALGTRRGGPLVTAELEVAGQGAMAAFIERRRANLAVLERCTADELGRPVDWPGRRWTTVADLVAIMLASDTELLGELRRRDSRR